MQVGDIAFKCNFATLDSNIVISRRADRHFEKEGKVLSEYLDGTVLPSFPNHEIMVKKATEHRCAVRVRGPNLSCDITGTDPLKDHLPLQKSQPIDSNNPKAILTSKLVNELSDVFHKKLSNHPINQERKKIGKPVANIVLLRGCGIRINVPPFEELHQMKAFMIAPTCIIRGIGISFGMKQLDVQGATGDCNTNLDAKRSAFVEFAAKNRDYNFGFLHIKAVDEAGHDKNPKLKVQLIEKIDKMVGKLLQDLKELKNEEWYVVVTGDHTTPVDLGDHSCEPVPFVISKLNKKFSGDGVEKFSEIDASKGALGRFPGSEVMNTIKTIQSKY